MRDQRITLTVAEYRALKARADRIRASRVAQARKVGAECGIGAEMPFHLAANAMVGQHYGHPWRGVDYNGVRRILWLERESWRGHILVDRLVARRGVEPF